MRFNKSQLGILWKLIAKIYVSDVSIVISYFAQRSRLLRYIIKLIRGKVERTLSRGE